MPNANKSILMGNITRDPQLRYTPAGTAVLDLGLAINRHWKDGNGEKKEETTFVDVTFWSGAAETINTHAKKGDPLYIEGRLHLEQWDDKETGQARSKLKVIGEVFQFLGGSSGKQQGQQSQDSGQGYSKPPVSAGDDLPY